jgi:osmotically-inducible protein OsmY
MVVKGIAVGIAATVLVAAPAAATRERRSQPTWATALMPIAWEIASNEAPPPAAAEDEEDADNTGRNVRDRDGSSLTPTDQGDSEADRSITTHIRREIVANDALSTNAQNAKIITVGGVVTLRGPVKSEEEKAAIGAVAQRAPGVKRVDNQLEIERDE